MSVLSNLLRLLRNTEAPSEQNTELPQMRLKNRNRGNTDVASEQNTEQNIAAQNDERVESECLHDEDDRIDARRMGAPTAWICRRCGYRGD